MELVNMETHALSHMEIMSSKRRSTFLQDIRQSSVNNSMRALTVHMVTDANSFTRPSLMKFNKRKARMTKIKSMMPRWIWKTSWVIDKCWMIISSVLSKDLQAHRTLIWMNSIWSIKMLSTDCQFLKQSLQILLLSQKFRSMKPPNRNNFKPISSKNTPSLKLNCKLIWELKLNIKRNKEWLREPRCSKNITINNIWRPMIRCNNRNTITPTLSQLFRPLITERPFEYELCIPFLLDLRVPRWFKFTHGL